MSGASENTRLRILSPAKINLFLHVLGKRSDGYHDLQTLFQFLELHDIVELELTNRNVVERIDLHDFELPKIDLTVSAANLLDRYKKSNHRSGVRITLNKTIPCGAGMGGGSSNAAAVLVGLNHLWGLHLEESVLLELGLQLGADVPLFIRGHSCWAEGVGDKLTTLAPPERWHVIWIVNCHVSTKQVFEHSGLNRNHPKVAYSDYLEGCCSNSLEPVVRDLFKPVDSALEILGQYGKAQLNGTGSSVFLPCSSYADAQLIRKKLPANENIQIMRSINTFERFPALLS